MKDGQRVGHTLTDQNYGQRVGHTLTDQNYGQKVTHMTYGVTSFLDFEFIHYAAVAVSSFLEIVSGSVQTAMETWKCPDSDGSMEVSRQRAANKARESS